MTDSELLELAAKAAGIKVQYSENMGDFSIGEPYSREEKRWTPLSDDGDAFRLAVKCDIAFGRSANTWWARWEFSDKVFRENAEKDGVQDPFAAARLAILRAAAEIGRSIP